METKITYLYNRGEKTILMKISERASGRVVRTSTYAYDTPAAAEKIFDMLQRGGHLG